MIDLTGKVALVTGAEMSDADTVGIGGATARLLARLGAAVACSSRNPKAADRLADHIRGAGGQAIGVDLDVSDHEQVQAGIETTVGAFGGLDIVHNNAAALDLDVIGRDLSVDTMELDLWEHTLRVNLTGSMLVCKYAIPRMLERGAGVIVNTSSVNGLRGDVSRPAYGVSKAGLNLLTLNIAATYGKRGIRCNAICPGLVLTPVADLMLTPETREIFDRHHLLPSLLEPEAIAKVVAFLVSDAAASITGQLIATDGGLTASLPFVADFMQLATP